MSTIIPDTIMGCTEITSTTETTPQDIGGIIVKKEDYPMINRIYGFIAGMIIGSGSGKIGFYDYFDNNALLGEIEFDVVDYTIEEVELQIPESSPEGWSCILIKHYSVDGSTTMITALAGVRIC